jgi:hypothetical protein
LLQSLYQFASSPRHPLTETEIFSGTILGRDGGKQSKCVREITQAMREQLEEVLTFTISRIIDVATRKLYPELLPVLPLL